MLTKKRKKTEKEDFLNLSEALLEWLSDVMDYLREDRWWFKVNSKGEYVEGTQWAEYPPEGFSFQSTVGCTFTFRLVGRPRSRNELKLIREKIHKIVTTSLVHSVGYPKANKLLAHLREEHDLPKITRKLANYQLSQSFGA
mgnify:CR=1 FL=1